MREARVPMLDPAVVLREASIGYGDHLIQEKMNITIDRGEFVAVLGPNGAGKSTLLKAVLGLLRPVAGEVAVLGERARRGNRRIGYAPQFRALETDFALRARDLVGFGLDGHRWGPGWPSRRRRALIDSVIEEVSAAEYADVPVGELSGGEKQRLLIAQALLADPELLLLDEPLANLDLARAKEIIELVERLCRTRNVAVLFVTHDINPLSSIVDRVLYLANGRSTIGTPAEVITRETLTALYGKPVEVVEAMGKLFVVGVEI
jgi:zinc/manganese transport system ATP-binding protein